MINPIFSYSYDPEQFAGTHTPILVIGTKLDQAQVVRENALKRSSSIAEECGADEINLVRVRFYWSKSNIASRLVHRESNFMITSSSNKNQRKYLLCVCSA